MSSPETRLAALGLALPPTVPPAGAYASVVRDGHRWHTSGQVPWREGTLLATGRLGAEVNVEQGVLCARQCALNALAALATEAGAAGLAAVYGVVRATVYLATTTDFTDHVAVADGASTLLTSVFGEAGGHARTTVGVASLPLGAPVELELLVTTRPTYGAPR